MSKKYLEMNLVNEYGSNFGIIFMACYPKQAKNLMAEGANICYPVSQEEVNEALENQGDIWSQVRVGDMRDVPYGKLSQFYWDY